MSASAAALPAAGDVRRIAFLMLGEIGDTLVTTPALRAVKREFPSARVSLIVRPAVADVVRHNPDVDELVLFRNGSFADRLRSLGALVGRRWDLWIDLHTPTFNTWCSNERVFRRNALLMALSRSRYRRGFAQAPLTRWLTHPEPVPERTVLETENIVDTTFRLVGSAREQSLRKTLVVAPADREWARRYLEPRTGQRVPFGFFFGSKQPSATWPEANVRAFLRLLGDAHPDRPILLVGGPHETALARRLAGFLEPALASRLIDAVGQTTLGQTAALVESCAAFVTTDSGPMHMADALGVPLVVLFSSRNFPSIWRPLQPGAEVLNVPVPCGPCFLSVSTNDTLCMASIRPEDVLAALERRLASVEARRG